MGAAPKAMGPGWGKEPKDGALAVRARVALPLPALKLKLGVAAVEPPRRLQKRRTST